MKIWLKNIYISFSRIYVCIYNIYICIYIYIGREKRCRLCMCIYIYIYIYIYTHTHTHTHTHREIHTFQYKVFCPFKEVNHFTVSWRKIFSQSFFVLTVWPHFGLNIILLYTVSRIFWSKGGTSIHSFTYIQHLLSISSAEGKGLCWVSHWTATDGEALVLELWGV